MIIFILYNIYSLQYINYKTFENPEFDVPNFPGQIFTLQFRTARIFLRK